MKLFFALFSMIAFHLLQAQQKVTAKKLLCNPLVIGSIPKKALSFQYEYQGNFSNSFKETYNIPMGYSINNFANAQSIRLGYYKNIITKPKTYVTLDAGYWFSNYSVAPQSGNTFFNDFSKNSFHSFQVASNIFKPLNDKNFILINASIELNGNAKSLETVGLSNVFVGGAVIYGWKKGLNSMSGVGLLRAYRFGRAVLVPAFLLNKNFNTKWGVEMLLPARALLRYAPNKKNLFTTGYELEGAQFGYSSSITQLNNTFFQRGEIRPKIGWETTLGKNLRFTTNIGVRINGRMDLASKYDGKNLVVENNANPNIFFNVGLHVLNFVKKKK